MRSRGDRDDARFVVPDDQGVNAEADDADEGKREQAHAARLRSELLHFRTFEKSPHSSDDVGAKRMPL